MAIFTKYLDDYGRANAVKERKSIERQMWKEYGVSEAIFVLDLSGFSRLVSELGIVHYLSMIRRMRVTLRPLVEHNNGHVVKFEADNCFARFPNVADAIKTAITYNHTLEAMNITTPSDFDIHAAIGIDFGRFLLVRKTDMFGDPMNIASKLGEDLAKAGEILVSKRAMIKLKAGSNIQSQAVSGSISGMSLEYHKISY